MIAGRERRRDRGLSRVPPVIEMILYANADEMRRRSRNEQII